MYEQYFGLLSLPFRVTPDPRVFYSNSSYEEAFATLRYGIEGRKGFIVVTGEVGTGKTTLLKIFMRSADSTIHTAYVFNPKLSFTELLRFILNDLGITPSAGDNFTLIKHLNDYLIRQYESGQIVALLLDEAQNLSTDLLEQLRLLSNLETDDDKLIQIVLMGQPELEQRLEQPELRQLKQRVALRCRLTPLQAVEVRHYIDLRLKTAGYKDKELFDHAAVERITRYSAGIPRLINVICDNALLLAYALSKKKVSAELIEEAARDLKLIPPAATQMHGNKPNANIFKNQKKPRVKTPPSAPNRPKQTADCHGSRSRIGLAVGASVAVAILVVGGVVLSDSRGRDYLSNLTSGGSSFINMQVEKLNPAKLMPSTFMENSKSLVGYSDSSPNFDWNQAAQAEQLSTSKDPDSQTAVSSHSNDVQTAAVLFPYVTPDPKDHVAPVQKKNEPVESGVTEPRVAQAQKSASTRLIPEERDKPKPQRPEPELFSPRDEPPPIDSQKIVKKEQQFFQGVFEVIDNCLVFDRPQREAAVITTLPSRTWIRVEKKDGNYLLVNSLNDPAVRGYVALEDASFERIGK